LGCREITNDLIVLKSLKAEADLAINKWEGKDWPDILARFEAIFGGYISKDFRRLKLLDSFGFEPRAGEFDRENWPVWLSPDGEWVVKPGDYWSLSVENRKTGDFESIEYNLFDPLLGKNPSLGKSFQFSPDGRKVLFTINGSNEETGEAEYFVVEYYFKLKRGIVLQTPELYAGYLDHEQVGVNAHNSHLVGLLVSWGGIEPLPIDWEGLGSPVKRFKIYGDMVFVLDKSNSLVVWDFSDQKVVFQSDWRLTQTSIDDIFPVDGGKKVIIKNDAGIVLLYDLAKKEISRSMPGYHTCAAADPSGQFVAAADSLDFWIDIFDIRNDRFYKTGSFPVDGGPVEKIMFTPDHEIVVCFLTGDVKVYGKGGK